MNDSKRDSPIPDHVQMNMMYSYIARYGSKITDRKCCFDPENYCDILCPHFKVVPFTYIITSGYALNARCFCIKFEPPYQMEELKIHPLNKEEAEA